MNLYAIFGANDAKTFDDRVPKTFPECHKITSGQWLIGHKSLLPAEVYKALEDNGGDLYCVICSADRYYGYADKRIWSWAEKVGRDKA